MLPKGQMKWLLLLVLVSTLPVVLNGYPIVQFDTGNYSAVFRNVSSFYDAPIDRPIFYAVYVWITSIFGSTLKLIPISQAIIFSWLLIKLVEATCVFSREGFPYCTLIVLVAISYLPFLVSAVMPDIWTSLMGIACMVLLMRVNWDFKADAILYVIIALAIAFAPANALILALSLLPISYRLIKRKLDVVGMLILSAVVSLVLCALTTFLSFREFKIIKGSQAFMFARLMADNNARKGIEELCRQSPAATLCVNSDMLVGKTNNEIVWSELGEKLDVWKDTRGEVAAVIRFSFQRDFVAIVATSIKNTLRTLTLKPNSLQDLYAGPYQPNTFVFQTIQSLFPNDFPSFSRSMQQSNPEFYLLKRLFEFYAVMFWFQVGLSVALGLYHVYKRAPLRLSSTFAISFAAANAIVCASLSGLEFRYNVKAMSVTLLILTFTLVNETLPLKKVILSRLWFYQRD